MQRVHTFAVLFVTTWLSACATPAPQAPPVQAAYRVVGTEPFWGIRVDGDALHFTTLDDQAGKHLRADSAPSADGVRYEGSDGATAFRLDLQRGACSDGMSDRSYAYRAAFRYGTTDYVGCADAVQAE